MNLQTQNGHRRSKQLVIASGTSLICVCKAVLSDQWHSRLFDIIAAALSTWICFTPTVPSLGMCSALVQCSKNCKSNMSLPRLSQKEDHGSVNNFENWLYVSVLGRRNIYDFLKGFQDEFEQKIVDFLQNKIQGRFPDPDCKFWCSRSWICVPGSPSHHTLLTKLSYFITKQTPLTSISQGTGSESMSSTLTRLRRRRTHCFSNGKNCYRLRNGYLSDFCPQSSWPTYAPAF